MNHIADYRNAAIAAAEESGAVCIDVAKTVKSEFDKMKMSSASKAHSTFIKRYATVTDKVKALLSDEGAEYVAGLLTSGFKANAELSALSDLIVE